MNTKITNHCSGNDFWDDYNKLKGSKNHNQNIPDPFMHFQLSDFELYRWISDEFKFIGVYNYNDLPTDAVCGDICRVFCPNFVTDYAGNKIKNLDFVVRTRKGWLKLETKIDKKKNNKTSKDYAISINGKFEKYLSNLITLSDDELLVLNKLIEAFPSLKIKIISLDD